MTDAEKLKVYDVLREVHHRLRDLYDVAEDGTIEDEAITTVDCVLYLAEGVFAKIGD